MSIPRSTRAGRGELSGAAATARQTRVVTVRVEQIRPGMLRVSQPAAPGWAAVARTPIELARAVAGAFTEAQVAAYSSWRGRVYDGADQGSPQQRRRPRNRAAHRSDTHDPREWSLAADGRWVSPSGKRWPERTQTVQRVIAARVRMNLPPTPDPDPVSGGRTGVLRGRGEAG